jgi:arylsulfatase
MEDGWVRGPMRKMMMAFEKTLKANPPIAPGAPDEFKPICTDTKSL